MLILALGYRQFAVAGWFDFGCALLLLLFLLHFKWKYVWYMSIYKAYQSCEHAIYHLKRHLLCIYMYIYTFGI